MSTTSEPIIFKYTGDGETDTFPFQCYVLREEDMHVFINDIWINPSTYSVTGVGDESGGAVVFSTAPTNGALITLFRYLNWDRETDYQDNGPFLEEVVNADQDTQTQQIQQLVEELSRVIRLPIGTDLGYCSIDGYSDQTSCEMNGGEWINTSDGGDGEGVPGGAFCSIPDYTTQQTCEDNEGTWFPGSTINGYCTDPQWTTQASCQLAGNHWITNAGYCSLTQYTNKPACIAGGGTWTSQSGWCSDPDITDQATCLLEGNTWEPSGAYCSINPLEYTDEATCLANNGQWIVRSGSNILPDPVADGIWKWNDTATEIEYIFVDDLVQDVIDALPDPSPQSLEYYGWSLAFEYNDGYWDQTMNFENCIDDTATELFIVVVCNTDNASGVALQFLTDDTLTAGSYNGTTTSVSGVDQSITMQDCEEAFGILDAQTYIPLAKSPVGSLAATVRVKSNNFDVKGYDLGVNATPDSSLHTGEVTGPVGNGIRIVSVDDIFTQSGTAPTIKVYQYAKTLELEIDALVAGGGGGTITTELLAEYGDMGTYFVNTGTADDLVFVYNGNRTEYPPVLEGQSIWFLATGNNTGNVTAQLGSQPALSVLDEDGSELPANTFATNKQYRIYKRGSTFRYAIPASATVGNKSITLAKLADGTPNYYLGFDAEGVAEWKEGSGGVFTDTYVDATGTNSTGAGQSITWAHGLGDVPFGYLVEAECLVESGGYPVGRRIKIDSYAKADGQQNQFGVTISADDTNIYLKVTRQSDMRAVGTDGKVFGLAANQWKFYAKAWI